MTKKDNKAYENLINRDSNEVETFGVKGSLNKGGHEITTAIGLEVVKMATPIAVEAVKNKIELDQETQKLVRDDKREILKKRAETLQLQIEKEEEKEDYNQERINRWTEDLSGVIEKLDSMDAKSEGFTKGLLLSLLRKN